jgi:predicted ATPase
MNRLDLQIGGLSLLLHSQDLALGDLAERYASFLGGKAGHDLVVDLTLVQPAGNLRRESVTNGSRSVLERQLQRRYAHPPAQEGVIRQKLEEGAHFLSDPAFVKSLMACENSDGQYQLVEVSQPGVCFLDRGATRGRVFAREPSSEHRASQLDGYFRCLLSLALVRRSGVVLHAAGVVEDEGAYLFVGPSGSGKTTIARAARERGWAVLADDGVIVRESGPSGLRAFRSPWNAHIPPWSGDFGNSPESAPVRAIFFIEQGRSDVFTGQEPTACAVRLARGTYSQLRWAEADDADSAFALLIRASRHVPCYTLSFTIDCSFLEEIRGGEI